MFIVVGERINTSRKGVQKAVESGDRDYIRNEAVQQEASGASYLDVNSGTQIGNEKESILWLIDTIQACAKIPLCLDSPDPEVLMMAYKKVNQKPMINSISLEENRYEPMMFFLKGKDCKVIALCLNDDGMPNTAHDVVKNAGTLIKSLEDIGVKREDIYIDPLVQPIGTDCRKGVMVMEAISAISKTFQGVHFMCGLSNISFGLPERKIINRHFLSLMMASGLDGAILDPMDTNLMTTLLTTEMLLGKDNYCMNFIKSVRSGVIRI